MTEDEICLKLGYEYGIARGLDCGPNITMCSYHADGDWVQPNYGVGKDGYRRGIYEADFLYITKRDYLYEVEIKVSIADFRADQKKTLFHNSPDVKGWYYCVPCELYDAYAAEIELVCKDTGAGLIIYNQKEAMLFVKSKPKIRKEVKPLTSNRYFHYLRLFSKKWVRSR